MAHSHPGYPLSPLQVNRFGVIPKGHNTGKWRLIMDLSYPPEQSVNDSIDPQLYMLPGLHDSGREILEVGRSPLAKIDIELANTGTPG